MEVMPPSPSLTLWKAYCESARSRSVRRAGCNPIEPASHGIDVVHEHPCFQACCARFRLTSVLLLSLLVSVTFTSKYTYMVEDEVTME